MPRKPKTTKPATPPTSGNLPPLNPRQRRFVDEYLVDLNGTQAAIRAGYSKNGADATAVRFLGDSRIQPLVAERREALARRTTITADRVLLELGRIAFSDIREYYKADGSLKKPHELSDDAAAALSGIETEELYEGRGQEREQTGVVRKIRRFSKEKALELIGKHLGMFEERVKHEVTGTLKVVLSEEEAGVG